MMRKTLNQVIKRRICNKFYSEGDNKVRDHDHVTGKYGGSAHKNCDISLRLTKKSSVTFQNIRGYDSHLIIQEIGKFDVEIYVIPNRLEKSMAFTVNRNLVCIDSMQFMNSSLDVFVKNVSSKDFRYLSQDFSGEFLELVKQKGVYPYEYMNSFKVGRVVNMKLGFTGKLFCNLVILM